VGFSTFIMHTLDVSFKWWLCSHGYLYRCKTYLNKNISLITIRSLYKTCSTT